MIEYDHIELHDKEYVKVLKCINENVKRDELGHVKNNSIILLIPGNPGLIEFYENFAIYLNQHTKLPVYGVSHTGHLNGNGHGIDDWQPADLSQQIQDKIKYIQTHFSHENNSYESFEFILIGHSIGCHIILKMLSEIKEKNSEIKIRKSILLFPTIERMSESPQGKIVTPILNYLWFLTVFAIFLVSRIPHKICEKILSFYLSSKASGTDMDNGLHKNALKIATSFSCMKSFLYMAKIEMMSVRELDFKLFEDNLHKLVLYYGVDDHWCPVHFYHETKSRLEELYPHHDISKLVHLDEKNLDHAFVIFNSQTKYLSELSAGWINNFNIEN